MIVWRDRRCETSLSHMKTATVRQLRNEFPKVERWLQAGEEVRLTKRGKLVASIVPAAVERAGPPPRPDFMARLKAIYGDKVLPDSQVIFDEQRADRA